MVIAGSKRSVALGALPLSCLVPRSETVVAETVEALGQHCVLSLHLARRTRQRLLVLANLLSKDLVHVGRHLDLLEALYLSLDDHEVFMQPLRLEGLGLESRRLLRHGLLDLLDLGVVLLQMELQIGCGLCGLDGLPLVHLHGLLAHRQLLVDRRQVRLKQTLLLLQLTDHLKSEESFRVLSLAQFSRKVVNLVP